MSIVNITYDTKEKTLDVKLDGKAVANVIQVSAYKYGYSDEDPAHIEITSGLSNEDEGMYERHCIYAHMEEKTIVSSKKDEYLELLSNKIAKQLRVS